MNVMGILLTSNKLRIVSLSGDKTNHIQIEPSFNKIEIPKKNEPEQLSLIKDTLISFISTHEIEVIAINGRASSGQMSGGPLTFKSEGFLVAIANIEVKNIFPSTIRSSEKKNGEYKLNKPTTVDLGKAYDLAFEVLP